MNGNPVPAGLHIVGTPLGNLSDLSPRAAETLRAADVLACEDTRRSAVLARHVGAHGTLVSLHAHNEASRTAEVIRRLRAGDRVALLTDAGMPSVSDPGARLVEVARHEGVPVHVVPGPSAVTTAVAACGAPGDRFVFVGFMPRKAGERAALLESADATGSTVVAFESPHRLPDLLAWLAARDPSRTAAVCRELTKRFEEVVPAPVAELAERFGGEVRGEVTLVLWPAARAEPDDGALRATVRVLLEAGLSAARAADAAAALGAGRRNAAYAIALDEDRRRST